MLDPSFYYGALQSLLSRGVFKESESDYLILILRGT